jgi:hypothetical protein
MAHSIDRRKHPRVPIPLAAQGLSDQVTGWSVLVINLSRGGVRLVVPAPVVPPPFVLVKIQNPGGEFLERAIREVHLQSVGNFRLVGCAFEMLLTKEEFSLLVGNR